MQTPGAVWPARALGAALFITVIVALPTVASADVEYGVYPGFRLGYGRSAYRGTDPLGNTQAEGETSWARLQEVYVDAIAVLGDRVAAGLSLGSVSCGISNPVDNHGDDFTYGGWTVGAVGMLNLTPRVFLSGRWSMVKGTAEIWMRDAQSSAGWRAGGALNWAFVHNELGTMALSLGVDRLSSGKLAGFATEEVRFGATVFSLGLTGAFAGGKSE